VLEAAQHAVLCTTSRTAPRPLAQPGRTAWKRREPALRWAGRAIGAACQASPMVLLVMGFGKEEGADAATISVVISPKPAARELALVVAGLAWARLSLVGVAVTIAERYWLPVSMALAKPWVGSWHSEQLEQIAEPTCSVVSRPPATASGNGRFGRADLVRRWDSAYGAAAITNRRAHDTGQGRQNPILCPPRKRPPADRTSCDWVPVSAFRPTPHLMGVFRGASAGPPRQGFFGRDDPPFGGLLAVDVNSPNTDKMLLPQP